MVDGARLEKDGWHFFLDGRRVAEKEYRGRYPLPESGPCNVGKPWARPLVSQALAVHPTQVGEANERNRKAGVNVQYDERGRAVIPDRNERRKLLKLEGMIDQDSYTGY